MNTLGENNVGKSDRLSRPHLPISDLRCIVLPRAQLSLIASYSIYTRRFLKPYHATPVGTTIVACRASAEWVSREHLSAAMLAPKVGQPQS